MGAEMARPARPKKENNLTRREGILEAGSQTYIRRRIDIKERIEMSPGQYAT